jgi:hypothetical protein
MILENDFAYDEVAKKLASEVFFRNLESRLGVPSFASSHPVSSGVVTKPDRFTFKNQPSSRGLASVGEGTPNIDIMYKGELPPNLPS